MKKRSMKYHLIFLFMFHKTASKVVDVEKIEFCKQIKCESGDGVIACGLRAEQDGFRLKLFENECDLLKYGCNVDEENAYGIINREFCESIGNINEKFVNQISKVDDLDSLVEHNISNCDDQCSNDTDEVCGIRDDGEGYRVRLFKNKCHLNNYNCENNIQFSQTDVFICNKDVKSNVEIKDEIGKAILKSKDNVTNIVVVNTQMLGEFDDLNDTIDAFFAASHVFDLPIKEVRSLETRRKLLKYAGPVKVFVPVIVKPQNISNDTEHIPTLSTCYHKCPTKCPDTYAPVCGVPGIVAREPALIFQNHCFMDVAQCKMFYEEKSSTAHSSSYLESSFLFCMGDEINAISRFLPTIRTLQHMGRLKKKGQFKAKLRNFRFLRDFKSGNPNFMG